MTVYSHSRLSSFENCPLQYRFRYIDRIRSDVQGVEAFVGKLVHEVLEQLYADLDAARRAGVSEFASRFDALWRRKASAALRIVKQGMTLEDYRALGERCVRNFYGRYHPFDSGDVIGCETRVDFSLDEQGRYRMLGYIDRIDRLEGDVLEIHDYKTGSLPRAGALRHDRQLTLYEVALRQKHAGVRQVRHVWHYLAHDREFVEQRTAEDLRKARMGAIHAIQRIEETVDFPARPGVLCSWCDYLGICPEGRSRVEPPTQSEGAPPPPDLQPGTDQYLLFGGARRV